MNMRQVMLVVSLLCLAGGTAFWHWRQGAELDDQPDISESADPLPIPPVPPRIAEGEDYENCLAMLPGDPAGASSFADAWEATGGGEGAQHCLALADIALGDVEVGAALLERLAATSHAAAVARAAVYGQAGQAWLIAGDPDRAFGATSLALSLSGDDPDLLIDRATSAMSLGRWDDAIDDLTRALEIDHKRSDAFVLRGTSWRQTGHLERAQDDVDRAFTLDPEDPEAFLERGILRQRHGDRAGAQKDWVAAKALAPDTATSDLAEQNLALLDAGPDRK